MKVKNIFGKDINKSFKKYKINWDKVVSKPQKRIKDLIKPYWEGQDVYEELVIPSSKLRIDLVNFTTKTVIEVSPKHHKEYNKFLHGSRLNFLEAQKRDLKKNEWCDANGINYIEIDEEDLKKTDKEILDKIIYDY